MRPASGGILPPDPLSCWLYPHKIDYLFSRKINANDIDCDIHYVQNPFLSFSRCFAL